jgi:signal transduction histidine kinase
MGIPRVSDPCRLSWRSGKNSYPAAVTERASVVEPQRWGDDPKLVELLGEQGAAGFRALFDGFPEAVGVLWALRDTDGRIVDFSFGYGNPSILRAFRLPPGTRDRFTLLQALPRMRGSRALAAYVAVCETGAPHIQEATYDTPLGDGYMLGTFVTRTAKLGDGLINFLSDVTRERRMEADLSSYADVVAHDLNAPIASIALLLGLLERRPGEPPPAGVLAQLRANTERARDLIDGVLDYARAGELTTERLALGDLVAEVVDAMRPQLDSVGAQVDIGRLPKIDGDPRQLRRVVQNLLANALKYRSDTPLRVSAGALRDEHEWVITLRDNGIGVPPEQAGRIFGMFSRGTASVDGAGLGLAVCRRIIEAHGGRIWVEPVAGAGSAFRFTLPR